MDGKVSVLPNLPDAFDDWELRYPNEFDFSKERLIGGAFALTVIFSTSFFSVKFLLLPGTGMFASGS